MRLAWRNRARSSALRIERAFEKCGSAAHHEKLDGSGYWRGWGSEQLSRFARILAVADIFDALHAKRPYRDGIPLEKVFEMLRKDAPHALDLPCVEALIASKTNSEPLAFCQPEIAVAP
jgi:HD-GYP domain-containing protein (c-di-GMP phosphodiesterase class II)